MKQNMKEEGNQIQKKKNLIMKSIYRMKKIVFLNKKNNIKSREMNNQK